MADNVKARLRCQTAPHGPMERRLADRQPYAGAYSVWACLTCGVLALHLEWCGDIYWYPAWRGTVQLIPAVQEAWPEGLEGDGSHLAQCDYCPERFNCGCGKPDGPHLCEGCHAAAEESKMIQLEGGPGEMAAEREQSRMDREEQGPW